MNPLVPAFLSGIWDLGKQYFENKKEEKQAKHTAKIKLIEQDGSLISQADNSLKDEFWTTVFGLPVIQIQTAPVFDLLISKEDYVPGQWTEAVIQGVNGLSALPEWYIYLVGVSALFSFGIKPTAQTVKQMITSKIK